MVGDQVKINKFLKKNKAAVYIVSGMMFLVVAVGGYYLYVNQTGLFGKEETKIEDTTPDITTDAEVQQNITEKSQAAADSTTTPSVVAEKPLATSLADVSFTVLRDANEAYVSFYGPFGTYGVEKQVGGEWKVLIAEFSYSGKGDKYIDTISSSEPESHYRVFKLENGTKVATSGDTVILWQDILTKGAFSVPLAR